MSFLDDFGKKISTAGQEAIAKTKDFADVAKLNSNISDEQKRIKNAYMEIGKMYWEMHASDYDKCFEDKFVAIKESEEKIKEYEKQVIEIKGVKKCPSCGADVDKNSVFCAKCGTKIEEN